MEHHFDIRKREDLEAENRMALQESAKQILSAEISKTQTTNSNSYILLRENIYNNDISSLRFGWNFEEYALHNCVSLIWEITMDKGKIPSDESVRTRIRELGVDKHPNYSDTKWYAEIREAITRVEAEYRADIHPAISTCFDKSGFNLFRVQRFIHEFTWLIQHGEGYINDGALRRKVAIDNNEYVKIKKECLSLEWFTQTEAPVWTESHNKSGVSARYTLGPNHPYYGQRDHHGGDKQKNDSQQAPRVAKDYWDNEAINM